MRVRKTDLKVGSLIKTSLSEDVLVVQDMADFRPYEYEYFKAKLMANPAMAFKSKATVDQYLLGSNRCMALGPKTEQHPNGETFFPTIKQIFYIVNN